MHRDDKVITARDGHSASTVRDRVRATAAPALVRARPSSRSIGHRLLQEWKLPSAASRRAVKNGRSARQCRLSTIDGARFACNAACREPAPRWYDRSAPTTDQSVQAPRAGRFVIGADPRPGAIIAANSISLYGGFIFLHRLASDAAPTIRPAQHGMPRPPAGRQPSEMKSWKSCSNPRRSPRRKPSPSTTAAGSSGSIAAAPSPTSSRAGPTAGCSPTSCCRTTPSAIATRWCRGSAS